MKITKPKLRKIAKAAREVAESTFDGPKHNCLHFAQLLKAEIKKNGFPARLVYGMTFDGTHVWVECGVYWIDISGDQFGMSAVQVFLKKGQTEYKRLGMQLFKQVNLEIITIRIQTEWMNHRPSGDVDRRVEVIPLTGASM